MTDELLPRVLDAVRTELGDPSTWGAPVQMRDSLALCALNAVHTLQAGTPSVRRVLQRYRDHRIAAGADPEADSGPDLLAVIDAAGGPEGFSRDVIANQSKLPGTMRLRAEGIYEGLRNLEGLGITTAEHLREHAHDPEAKRAWTRVKGLGSQSWDYVRMNAGVEDVTKPDEMVRRFLYRAVAADVSPTRARQLVIAAAAELGVSARALDRAMWLRESPSGDGERSCAGAEEES
ncbi:hypothetical protein [Brachybacterium sp. NPDC056505]|uniref:hypothetical protein n=1 Tax=Brachybacterium sp. NPDC056505 TaxID=3345843 RepID=UPI003671FA1D